MQWDCGEPVLSRHLDAHLCGPHHLCTCQTNIKQLLSDVSSVAQAAFHLHKLLGAIRNQTYLLITTKLKVCPVSEVTRSLIRFRTGIHGLGEKVTPEYVYVTSGSP